MIDMVCFLFIGCEFVSILKVGGKPWKFKHSGCDFPMIFEILGIAKEVPDVAKQQLNDSKCMYTAFVLGFTHDRKFLEVSF